MTKASQSTPRGQNARLRIEIRDLHETIQHLVQKIEALELALCCERTITHRLANRQSAESWRQ